MVRVYLDGGVLKTGSPPSSLIEDSLSTVEKLDHTHKYHLYAATGCPFAHSAYCALVLKGLEGIISVSYTDDTFGEEGWSFSEKNKDPLHADYKHLHQVYTLTKSDYSGKITVPSLFDVTDGKIVCNDSLKCIALFDEFGSGDSSHHHHLLKFAKDPKTAEEFENLKKAVVGNFNIGVYKAFFAPNQQAYEQAANSVFATMDMLEERLGKSRFIFGPSPSDISLIDIRVFVTYLRHIFVYRILFKLDKKDFNKYVNLNRFLRDFYQNFNLKHTVNIAGIKEGYYVNFESKVIPLGPDFDLDAKIEVK